MEAEMNYVYTVWKHRSFSKAARGLYLTQPALSAAVKRVETKLGLPLFDRASKPLQLTEAGKLYIEKVEQIRLLESELQAQVDDLHNNSSGILRIGTTHYFTAYVLPPVLRQYIGKYPGVRIELYEAGGIAAQKMLEECKIDLSFASYRRETEIFSHAPGIQDHLLLAVPSHFPISEEIARLGLLSAQISADWHLSKEHPWVSLEHFKDLPFMLLTKGHDMRRRTDALFQKADVIPQVIMEGEQFIAGYHLAIQGVCAAFVYDKAVLDTGADILYFKLDPSYANRIANLVTNPKNYVSNSLLQFMRMFQAYYADRQ